MDGLDVARELRRTSATPIVMLTARGEEIRPHRRARARCRRLPREALQSEGAGGRVRAVLRRTTGTAAGAEVLRAAGVEVDLPKMRARVDGRAVELTPTEFQLLATFVREPGRVFTRGQLLDALHGVTVESVRARDRRTREEPPPQDRARGRDARGTCSPCTASATGSPMPEHDERRGAPWRDPNWDGPPPWAGRGRPRFDGGRRFRRGAIAVLVLVVLLVAALATVVASAFGGNAPHPIVTVPLALAVVAALVASARWLWRNTRAIGTLMDAADRVAGGDYTTRVEVDGFAAAGTADVQLQPDDRAPRDRRSTAPRVAGRRRP